MLKAYDTWLTKPNHDRTSAWANVRWGDFKASKLYCVSTKNEFLWIKHNAISATDIKPISSLMKTFLDGVCPKQSIIDTLCFVSNVSNNLIISSSISISRSYVALRGGFVPIPTLWCDKCCQVAIFITDWDTVVTIPSVEDCLLFTSWDGPCL